MLDQDVLTIKEFASLANVSSQALYQRLNKSLQEYVVVIDNKKYLKREALRLFEREEAKEECKTAKAEDSSLDKDLLKTLQATIDILQGQLKAKDEQISELNARLKEALELNKGQVLLSVAERQQLPVAQDAADAAIATEEKPEKQTFWSRVKHWWE